MIDDLKWTALQEWRKTAQLAMLYRIHNNIIATDGIKSKLQPPSVMKTQSAVLAATLQNPVPELLVPQTAVIQNKPINSFF